MPLVCDAKAPCPNTNGLASTEPFNLPHAAAAFHTACIHQYLARLNTVPTTPLDSANIPVSSLPFPRHTAFPQWQAPNHIRSGTPRCRCPPPPLLFTSLPVERSVHIPFCCCIMRMPFRIIQLLSARLLYEYPVVGQVQNQAIGGQQVVAQHHDGLVAEP